MNTKLKIFFTLISISTSAWAFGQEAYQDGIATNDNEPVDEIRQISEVSEAPTETLSMLNQNVSLGQQIGATNFEDNAGNYTSRGTAGIGVDANLSYLFLGES